LPYCVTENAGTILRESYWLNEVNVNAITHSRTMRLQFRPQKRYFTVVEGISREPTS